VQVQVLCQVEVHEVINRVLDHISLLYQLVRSRSQGTTLDRWTRHVTRHTSSISTSGSTILTATRGTVDPGCARSTRTERENDSEP